jgi:hypothetical protein
MEQQKLNPTTVYVLSVLSLFCCCFWGIGSILSGIGFYIAQSKLKEVEANPENYEPNSVKAMNTAKIVAIVMLVINLLYLCYTIYMVYSIGWEVLKERSNEMLLQLQSA